MSWLTRGLGPVALVLVAACGHAPTLPAEPAAEAPAVAALAPADRTVDPAAADPRAAPRLEQAPRDPGAVELVILGDTGEISPFTAAWRRAIAAEATKDAILVLGDLIYPHAPPCPTGLPDANARALIDRRVGAALSGLGAPVYLALGNHDISRLPGEPDRAACLIAWAADQPDLALPDRTYVVDLGVAVIAVIDTNALDSRAAALVRAAFDGHPGWRVLAGHHALRAYHDKAREDAVRPWLVAHGLRPDVYVNGHAHVLQLGVYDGVIAITSGSATDPRDRPACPPACGPGQLFGSSAAGYAVVRLDLEGSVEVAFKDADGAELWRWRGSAPGGRSWAPRGSIKP